MSPHVVPVPLPKTFRAAVIDKPGAPLVVRDVPLKMPGPGEVLVKVIACGVCHTDVFVAAGALGDFFPRITGHEIVGDVAAVGEGVKQFTPGQRVGGAWHGGSDGTCRSCQHGIHQLCDNKKTTGVHFDGGLGEYVTLRAEAVARVPTNIDPIQAAPLLCAGLTTFNAMRKQHVEQGNLVAIQGLGGLGHLALQYANKMGYHTVAISSGSSKREFARELGAHDYIDTSKEDVAEALQAMGGAAMIVTTAPSTEAMPKLLGGLQAGGKLVLLAPMGPAPFDTIPIVMRGLSIVGWLTGNVLDAEETIQFSQRHDVKCIVETYTLDEIQKAMEVCANGSVRFRAVVTM